MAQFCINPKHSDHLKLIKKVGMQDAQRMIEVNIPKHGIEKATDIALENAEQSPVDRYVKLVEASKNVSKPKRDKTISQAIIDNDTNHAKYKYTNDKGEKVFLRSVSELLDSIEETRYGGQEAGFDYADKGTGFHTLLQYIIEEKPDEIINEHLKNSGIPKQIEKEMKNIISAIKATDDGEGILLAEVVLADPERNMAGTADIVHLKSDGTQDIYDLKTVFRTPLKKDKKQLWDISENGFYKDKRYSTQLELYGRLTEAATGMPVSNKYIIPLEISFKDNNPRGEYDTINFVGFQSTDDFPSGGKGKLATRLADIILDTDNKIETPAINQADYSTTDTMSSITGELDKRPVDYNKMADEIMGKFTWVDKGIKYWKSRLQKKKIKFRNQDDEKKQRDEIITKELMEIDKASKNIALNIENYFATGTDVFIQGHPKMKIILDQYMVRNPTGEKKALPGLKVYNLNKIDAFKDKIGWFVIEDSRTKRFDLIYYGDNVALDSSLQIDRKSSISRRVFGDTLFGKYMSSGEAKYLLKSDLKATVADAKSFESALIMLEMKRTIHDATFGTTYLQSSVGSDVPLYVDLSKVFPVLRNALVSPNEEFTKQFPEWMRNLPGVRDDLLNYKNYTQNYFKTFVNYMDVMGKSENKYIVDRVNEFSNRQILHHDMIDILQKEIEKTTYSSVLEDDEKATKLYYLSEMYFQLNNVYTAPDPIGTIRKWISMPTNISDPVIQHIVSHTRQSLNAITRGFFNYRDKYEDALNKLFRSKTTLGGWLADKTLSQTSRYFSNLIEDSGEVIINRETEKTRIVKTFKLIDEDTPKFKALTPEEQNFIKVFNEIMMDFADNAGLKWDKGRIPLVKANFANSFYRRTHENNEVKMGEIAGELLQDMSEAFNFEGDIAVKRDSRLVNPFSGQQVTSKWEDMVGVYSDGHVSVEDNSQWSTNLETVLDMFVIASLRTSDFNRIGSMVTAAEALYNWKKSNLFEDRLGQNLEWLSAYSDGVLLNKSQDGNTNFAKVVRSLNKWASLSLIGLRPTTALVATTGQQLTAMSQAMANGLSGDVKFGLKDWMKAGAIVHNPKHVFEKGRLKIDLLLEENRLFNHDFSSIVSGYHRIGNKSIFKTKYMYGPLNAGDWLTRAQLMVAQMLHDGTWEAYSVGDDGQLRYDETKDKRFEGENGKIWKRELTKILSNEGGIYTEEDAPSPEMIGKLKRAYDARSSESIKFEADSVVGGFDRETRAMYSFYALGKLLMLFKTWLPARLNRGFDPRFVNETAGKWVLEDYNGEKVAVWQGREMEGILQTLGLAMFDLKQMMKGGEVAPLNEQQKENLYRLMGDMILLSAGTILAFEMLSESDDPYARESGKLVQRAMNDLLATYTGYFTLGSAGEVIAFSHTKRLLEVMWATLAGLPDPETSVDLEKFVDFIPTGSAWEEIVNSLYQGE